MRNALNKSVLSVLSLVAAASAGCSGGVEVSPQASTSSALSARTCPEAVTADDRGDPRNADGKIRQCFPGEDACSCDADDDCYALEGYVACTPVTDSRSTDVVDPSEQGPEPASDPEVAQPSTQGSTPAASQQQGSQQQGSQQQQQQQGSSPSPSPSPTPSPTPATTPPSTGGTVTPSNGLRAFPGAEGWGAAATGGRGGRVVYVTNLNTSGPGSLQDALDQTGPRYVLFKVSGVINGDVHVSHGDVTIAGQTSPGGVVVRGFHTTEEPYCDQQCGRSAQGVSNIVARHMRSRPAGGDFPDGLRVRYARNAIFDHFSMGNAEDEAVEISYTNNLTIQDSIFAETVGDHAQYGGMLINYTNPAAGYALDQLSLVRNTWNRMEGRLPEFSRESGSDAAGTTMRVELVNNLIHDQRYFIDVNPTNISGGTEGSAINYAMNWVGNYSFAPSSNHYGMIALRPVDNGTSAYFNDNTSNLWAGRADWDLNYGSNDYAGAAGERPSWARTAPHAFPTTAAMPSSGVRAYAAANAGAFPRDPMDRRLMGHVAAGTFDSAPNNVNPANDALALGQGSAPAAPTDTDNDGMPDAWETAHGLNPAVADHNGTNLSMSMTGAAGYTNLECYLNELSAQRVSGR